MRFAHEGMSLWFESDRSVSAGVAEADIDITLTVGVEPADASNRVEVRYRLNGGPTARMVADAVRHTGTAQYFRARFPAGTLRAGDAVEYTAVCRCAGRQVPSPKESERFGAFFHVVGVKPEAEGGAAPKKASLRGPIVIAARSAASLATFPIRIDATQLFYPNFFLLLPGGGVSETVSTDKTQELQLATGSHGFQFGSGMHADFYFMVTDKGNVEYDDNCRLFLDGYGTPNLTIKGLLVTLDALHLTGADPARPNETGVLLHDAQLSTESNPNAIPNPEDWIALRTIRLLPATGCGVYVGSGLVASFTFNLKVDGTFDYDPAFDSSQGGFLSGKGRRS
jgi:hypothetical protein